MSLRGSLRGLAVSGNGSSGFRLPGRVSTVLGSTLGSLATAFTGQLSLLLSGVLAARLLGPESRGHLALLALMPMVAVPIVLFGAGSAVAYMIAKDPGATRHILKVLIIPAVLQFIVCCGFQAVGVWILVQDESSARQLAGVVTLVVGPTILVQTYGLNVIQGLQRFRSFNLLRLLPPALYTILLVSTFAFDGSSLLVVVTMWATANVIAALVIVVVTTRSIPAESRSENKPSRADILGFGAKGFLGSASPLETFRVDQLIVGLFLPPVALGLYVTSLAFTNLPRFVAQSVSVVALPHIASQPTDGQARRAMWLFFVVTAAGTALFAVAMGIGASRLVPLVFGREFSDAVRPTQILLAASALFGARRVLGEGLRGRGFPGVSTAAEITSWLCLLPALLVLAPRWELTGVAIAILLASGISLAVVMLGSFRSRGEQVESAPSSTTLWDRLPPPPGLAKVRGRFQIESRSFIATGALILCAAVGLGITGMPIIVAAGGLPFAALLATAALARRAIRRVDWRQPTGTASEPVETAPAIDDALAAPRFLYYAGASSVAFLVVRPIGFLTLSDGFFLASLLLTVVTLALQDRLTFTGLPRWLVIGTVVYAIGAAVSSLTTPSVLASLAVLVRFLYVSFAWFWLGTVLLDRLKYIRTALVCWSASAAIAGLASLIQLRLGDVIPGTSPIYGRMTGLAQHFNDLGATTALTLVPALAAAGMAASTIQRFIRWGFIVPMVLAGILLSGSVGAIAAAGLGFVVWMSLRYITLRMAGVGLIAGLAILFVLDLQRDSGGLSAGERLSGATDSTSKYCTLCSRMETNIAAWDAIQENPIVGAGPAAITSTGYEVHNILLASWFEAGILGLLGMLMLLASVGATAIRVTQAARSEDEWHVGLALLASLSAVIVIGMGQPILFQRYGWVGTALIIALAQVQRSEAARTTAGPMRSTSSFYRTAHPLRLGAHSMRAPQIAGFSSGES